MLSAFANAFRIPELRGKILFTLAIIAVYRLGSHLPVPGSTSTPSRTTSRTRPRTPAARSR
jgi:preprotein translocase subunit SecY